MRREGNQKTENNMKCRSEPKAPTRSIVMVPPTQPGWKRLPRLPWPVWPGEVSSRERCGERDWTAELPHPKVAGGRGCCWGSGMCHGASAALPLGPLLGRRRSLQEPAPQPRAPESSVSPSACVCVCVWVTDRWGAVCPRGCSSLGL